ncbi:MAG: hypothetical protein OXG23_05755 [Chloroflexi bacterium]|nr:hypothetical protein [Chloroflexota bacterium]MCY3977584.1 hypothetical protein [Chloroflexota bacterium]
METVNANDSVLAAGNAGASNERIATLEERSQHAATKAELNRSMLWLYIALFASISGLLGGLMLHLHNTLLNEISEIRQLLIEVIQQMPGG